MNTDDVLAIPRFALVVMMGPSSCGKSTFVQSWFKPPSIVSSDACRYMVSGDESAEWASAEAFALLETWVTARLKLSQLTVVDATALEPRFRARMLELAREFHAPAILVALELPLARCLEQDRERTKPAGPETVERTYQRFVRSVGRLREEGWNRVIRLRESELRKVKVEIRPLRVDSPVLPPFDLIGDVHGCYAELTELLTNMGYEPNLEAGFRHPAGRRVVFVGDLIDRGPASLQVIGLAMRMHKAGTALMTPGNHDDKLLRHLSGQRVRLDHGFERTMAELDALPAPQRSALLSELGPWLSSLPPYLLLDGGKLVVAHAGLPEHLQGRLSRAVQAWALFGEHRTHRPAPGQPERVDWPSTYQGRALVIYGHTPNLDTRKRGNTLCIDQGCVFGGRLTAYRYPEGELVQVKAAQVYYPDDAPDLEDRAALENGSPAAVEARPAGRTDETSGAAPLAPQVGDAESAGSEPGTLDAVVNAGVVLDLGAEASAVEVGGAALVQVAVALTSLRVPAAQESARTTLAEGETALSEGEKSAEPTRSIRVSVAVNAVESAVSEESTPAPALLAAPQVDAGDRAQPLLPPQAPLSPQVATSDRGPGPVKTNLDLRALMTSSGLPSRFSEPISFRESELAGALEVLSESTVDPRWLVWIPPTLAICNSSQRAGFLEHPAEVVQYYRSAGAQIQLEEAHAGARAVCMVGKTEDACAQAIGIAAPGMIVDACGRAFFDARTLPVHLESLRQGLLASGAFERLDSSFLIFEAVIMPWAQKHQDFLARQGMPAAAALLGSRGRALESLELALRKRLPVKVLRDQAARDREAALAMQRALTQLAAAGAAGAPTRIAPIQILASERRVFALEDRNWQVAELDRWTAVGGIFKPTRRFQVGSYEQERAALTFWEQGMANGSAGLIARTLDPLPRQGHRVDVPAMKVRNRDYLRMLYGPQYHNPDLMHWLRERPSRQLRVASSREWMLALEGLERFVRGEGFSSYHPYALGVLASQQEVTDPRK